MFRERRTIQAYLLNRNRRGQNGRTFERPFASLVFSGKIAAAMRLLLEYEAGETTAGVLDLTSPESPGSTLSIQVVLLSKHPHAAAVTSQALCHIDPAYKPAKVHPVFFETLTG